MTFKSVLPVETEKYFSSNDIICYLEQDTSHKEKLNEASFNHRAVIIYRFIGISQFLSDKYCTAYENRTNMYLPQYQDIAKNATIYSKMEQDGIFLTHFGDSSNYERQTEAFNRINKLSFYTIFIWL